MLRPSAILSAVYAALAVLRQNLWRSLMTLTICGLGCGGVIVSAGLADMQLADIALQFFLEGMSLSTLGILAGSVVGLIVTALLTHAAKSGVAFDPHSALFPAAISLAASATACVWPALRAAQLEPAAALRP